MKIFISLILVLFSSCRSYQITSLRKQAVSEKVFPVPLLESKNFSRFARRTPHFAVTISSSSLWTFSSVNYSITSYRILLKAYSFIFLGLVVKRAMIMLDLKRRRASQKMVIAYHQRDMRLLGLILHPQFTRDYSYATFNNCFPVLANKKENCLLFHVHVSSDVSRFFSVFSVQQVIVVFFFPLNTPRNRRL